MRKEPCKECPFRKDSLPGYLGDASYDPERFLRQTEMTSIPCHMQVDWREDSDEKIEEKCITHACVGSLQFMNNQCKLPRGAREPGNDYQKLLDEAGKNEEVFKWTHEFIKHHSK